MSVSERLLAGEQVEVDELASAAFRAVFGSYVGATLFLASLAWFGLYWRLGFFSNDQYTFANALVGVLDGHLYVDSAAFGPESGATPGTHLVDGRVYGRNYGVVLVSALWLVGLELLSLVADVRVLLAGLWSLAVVGVGAGVGRWFDRRRAGVLAGTAVAVPLFVANLAVATPLAARWYPLVALQVTTALAAAFAAVGLYRLGSRCYSGRVGAFAGLVAVIGTPVGFWATLPKRHSVTAALVVLAMYTLYRSREADSSRAAVRFRALTYVWVGLATWVHAAEGFVLLVAIGVVDLPTARSNRPRDLGVIGLALFASLLPFFLTNAAISGNPVRPPRLLPAYGEGMAGSLGSDGAIGDGSDGSAGGTLVPSIVATLLSRYVDSYAVLLLDPGRAFRVFVRTGYVPTLRSSQDASIHLSVLTSMPLLGALAAIPVLAGWRVKRGIERPWNLFDRELSPVAVVDGFSVVYVVGLLGLFLTSLPLHHMLTVRYLHPLFVVGVYWVVRLPAVRRVVRHRTKPLATTYAATLVVGTAGYVGAVALGTLTLGESVQVYALVALPVAVATGIWALLASATETDRSVGAVLIGIAVGVASVYLLASGLSLFPVTGEFLLPVQEAISGEIRYTSFAAGTSV